MFKSEYSEDPEVAIISLTEAVRFNIRIACPISNFMDLEFPEYSSDGWRITEPKYRNQQLIRCALYMLNGMNGPLLKHLRDNGLCYGGDLGMHIGVMSGIIEMSIFDCVAPVRIFEELTELLKEMKEAKNKEHPLDYFNLSLSDYLDTLIMNELQLTSKEIIQNISAINYALGLYPPELRTEFTPREAKGASCVDIAVSLKESEIYGAMLSIIENLCSGLITSSSLIFNSQKEDIIPHDNLKIIISCPGVLLSQMIKDEEERYDSNSGNLNKDTKEKKQEVRNLVMKKLCGEILSKYSDIYMTYEEFLSRCDVKQKNQNNHNINEENEIQDGDFINMDKEDDNETNICAKRVSNICLLRDKLFEMRKKCLALSNENYVKNNRESLVLSNLSQILKEQASIEENISTLEKTCKKLDSEKKSLLETKEVLIGKLAHLRQTFVTKPLPCTSNSIESLAKLSTELSSKQETLISSLLSIFENIDNDRHFELSIDPNIDIPSTILPSFGHSQKNPKKSTGNGLCFLVCASLCVLILAEMLGIPYDSENLFIESLSSSLPQEKKMRLVPFTGRRRVLNDLEQVAKRLGVDMASISSPSCSSKQKLISLLYAILVSGGRS